MSDQKQTSYEKATFKLLEDFDAAAQNWGYQSDQGVGVAVNNSKAAYDEAKTALQNRLQHLHSIRMREMRRPKNV